MEKKCICSCCKFVYDLHNSAQAMIRCKGITRIGKQCSVTNSSTWKDNNGRIVAEPLCRGGEFCALHAKPFCTSPTMLDDFERMIVFILDLETTGVDIAKKSIVEIAAVHAQW